MTDLPPPPASIAEFHRILGPELTCQFLMRFGGAELFLSPKPQGRSEVEKLIGPEKISELAELGWPRRVPLAKRWCAQYLRATTGLSQAEIARRLGASDVTVRSYLKAAPGRDPRQMPLI
ncbi:MAG: helix-turn-helix domain-containing protein [Tabrizicola sp.]|jgi:hypothetical protein|nr:helix-turn-helix domain-containing protein [Tabrizicola sp.]